MRLLRPGQDTVLSWSAGAVECRVVASAGQYVLLQPQPLAVAPEDPPSGGCSLTYLEGMVPMGWDGQVEVGVHPGELRFRVAGAEVRADRRDSVRVPLQAGVRLTAGGRQLEGVMLDVSAGGLRVRHDGRLAHGSPVGVYSELPGGLVVDADAIVRVSEPGITSVEFTELRASGAAEIGQWTVGVMRASLAGSD